MSPQPRHQATGKTSAGQPAKPLQGEYGSGGSYGVGGAFKDDEPGSQVEESDDNEAGTQDPDDKRPPVADVHTRESETPPRRRP